MSVTNLTRSQRGSGVRVGVLVRVADTVKLDFHPGPDETDPHQNAKKRQETGEDGDGLDNDGYRHGSVVGLG